MLNQNLLLTGDDGYNLTKSLRFRSSASAYLNRTPAGAGSLTTWTISAWVKRGSLGGTQRVFSGGTGSTTYGTPICFAADTIDWLEFNGGSVVGRLTTTQVFRDPSAWYHIVCVWDSTNATSTNRMKMYVNGVQVTAFSSTAYPSSSASSITNNSSSLYLGVLNAGGLTQYFDGYLTEVNFIDGQALTPSSFGSTNALTGVWQPAKYTGTYGTNGFYLPFTNTTSTTTIGYDFSGNSNNWTSNNISLTAGTTYDSMTDVPTLTSATTANYCVLNPLNSFTSPVPQQANLYVPSTDYALVKGTFFVSKGKWYWECTHVSGTLPAYCGVSNTSITSYSQYSSSGISWYGHYDAYTKNFTATSTATKTPIAIGNTIGISVDCDAGEIKYYLNNTLVHTDTTLPIGEPITPTLTTTFSGIWSNVAFNFGQRPFAYTPPTGFVALNTYNLPTSTIVKGNTVMDATTFTGNSSGASVVNTAGFKPDFVWMKCRSVARNHELLNSVTGGSSTLFSNLTNAEATDQRISSFNSNGFTYTVNSNSANTGDTFVGWQWQAGQGTTSSNTNGSITSTVSVNASAGFSIATYTGNGSTGATVGHGLGVAPAIIIVKKRSSTGNWITYHTSTGINQYLYLNSTSASATATPTWGVSSTTFTLQQSFSDYNDNGVTYVAYCWSEIAGFSKFGSYTGNGSSDGPFIYTGFRPKFVLVKRADTIANWTIRDTARNSYNSANLGLFPNLSNADDSTSGRDIDILSNGFKIRGTDSDLNTSSGTYIYMAFAENPFKNALAR